ncbi:MAG: hypothetical protein HYT08_04880 [Candidatus Levybacteria bacterium]|nr:hypothetical protein [Candidatus Levybacteria bacterium]
MDNQENNLNNTPGAAQPVNDQGESQTSENHPMGVPVGNSEPIGEAPPVTAQAPADPPSVNPSDPPAVSPNQVDQGSNDQAPVRDNKLLLLIIGAVAVLIIFILIIMISGSSNKTNNQPVPTPQAQVVSPTPEDQGIVSEQPISSQQDVENALKEVDKTDPDAVGADLSQNDQDAASF